MMDGSLGFLEDARRVLVGLSSDEDINLATYNSTVIPILAITLFITIFYYAEAGTPMHTYVTVFVCYFSAFMFLFLVPADVASTILHRRSDKTGDYKPYDDASSFMRPQYATYYIIITILSNSVLLFQEYYNTDGYTGILARYKSVSYRMGYDYFLYLIAGVVVFGILMANGADAEAIVLTLILVCNTVNLFLLMFILGFGLIGFPKSMWVKSDIHRLLTSLQNSAAAQFRAVNDLILDHKKSVADLRKTKERLQSSQQSQELLDIVESMLSKCPDEFRVSNLGEAAVNKEGKVTIHTLAQLNCRLKKHRLDFHLAQGKLDTTKLAAYRAEDVIKCIQAAEQASRHGHEVDERIYWSITKQYSNKLEFYWWTRLRSPYYKFVAFCFFMLSIFSYSGVVGSFKGIDNKTSVYFSATHDDNGSGVGIAVFVLLTLGYAAAVTSWALFQFRFSGIMEMVPYRTSPTSMSFNARMIGRLAPPLAFFYLGWLYENGLSDGSWLYNEGKPRIYMPLAFTQFYKVDVLPGIGDVNIIQPAILLGVSALVLFNVFNYLMVRVGLTSFQFGEAIVTEKELAEGKRQIERHRKLMERAARRYSFRNMLRGAQNLPEDESEDATMGFCTRLYRWIFRRWYENILHPGSQGSMGSHAGNVVQNTPVQPRAPEDIRGTLEKGSRGMMSRYVSRYFVVCEANVGMLCFWKDEAAHIKGKAEEGSVDLESVASFEVNGSSENGGKSVRKKTSARLEIVFEGEHQPSLQLKCPDQETAARWAEALAAWKKYKLDLRQFKAQRSVSRESVSSVDYATAGALGTGHGAKDGQMRGTSLRSPLNQGIQSSSSSSSSSEARAVSGTRSRTSLSAMGADPLYADEDEEAMANHLDLDASLAQIDIEVDMGSDSTVGGDGQAFQEPRRHPPVEPRGSHASISSDAPPAALEGWLELKDSGSMKAFTRCYCRIDEGSGVFSVSESHSRKTSTPTLEMDLRLIEPTRMNHQHCFTLSDGESTHTFRVPPVERATKDWVECINGWHDHLLMHMMV